MQCPILLNEHHGRGPGYDGGPFVPHDVTYRCVHEQGQGHFGPHLWSRNGNMKGSEADRCH